MKSYINPLTGFPLVGKIYYLSERAILIPSDHD